MTSYVKDPAAKLEYGWDWGPWLLAVGDELTTSTWTVPVGLTKGTEVVNGSAVAVWLSGGTLGEDYTVVNRVTTLGGRTDERSFKVHVRDR